MRILLALLATAAPAGAMTYTHKAVFEVEYGTGYSETYEDDTGEGYWLGRDPIRIEAGIWFDETTKKAQDHGHIYRGGAYACIVGKDFCLNSVTDNYDIWGPGSVLFGAPEAVVFDGKFQALAWQGETDAGGYLNQYYGFGFDGVDEFAAAKTASSWQVSLRFPVVNSVTLSDGWIEVNGYEGALSTTLAAEVAPVPLPLSGGLLLAAMGTLGVLRRRAHSAGSS